MAEFCTRFNRHLIQSEDAGSEVKPAAKDEREVWLMRFSRLQFRRLLQWTAFFLSLRVMRCLALLFIAATSSALAGEPGMVWIPAGEFTMGTDDPTARVEERPAHRVYVSGFWMDVTDVTNANFEKFVTATGYVTTAERKPDWEELKKQLPPDTPKPDDSVLVPGALVFTPPDHAVPLDDMSAWWTWTPGASWRHPEGPGSDISNRKNHPAVQISWDDAVAYAKWAGKRLPTEAEWEYASRAGAEGKRYYWGNEFRPGGKWMANTWTGDFPQYNTAEDGFAGTSPVKSFPANAFGLYDMAGNVWQWCADLYRADAFATCSKKDCCFNPQGPTNSFNPTRSVMDNLERVTKGGSFLCSASYCESYRPTARRGVPPDTGSAHIGFRCVKDATAIVTSSSTHPNIHEKTQP